MTITPSTHPKLFRPIEVGPRTFYARYFTEGVSVALRDRMNAAYREAYMKVSGVAEFVAAGYNAWVLTPEGKTATDVAAMKLLLIPSAGEPEFTTDDLEWLTEADMNRALGFFDKPSEEVKNEQPQ